MVSTLSRYGGDGMMSNGLGITHVMYIRENQEIFEGFPGVRDITPGQEVLDTLCTRLECVFTANGPECDDKCTPPRDGDGSHVTVQPCQIHRHK